MLSSSEFKFNLLSVIFTADMFWWVLSTVFSGNPCPGSVKRNQRCLSWTATEVKSNSLLCQRLKRSTDLTSLDSDIGGKRHSGNWTPCSHLREYTLYFSLYAQSVGVVVPETNKPIFFFFMSSVHVTRMNTRIEYGKWLYFKILLCILLAYMHCIQSFSKSFFINI